MDLTRRQWILGAAAGAFLLPAGCTGRPRTQVPADGGDTLARFPGKMAMRIINDRPPCLETPWRYFRHDLTPNEAFYVRWHLQAIPAAVDLKTWRLRVDGAVDRPLELSMDDLRRLGERRGRGGQSVLGQLSEPVRARESPGRSGGTGRWATPAGRGSGSPGCSGRRE